MPPSGTLCAGKTHSVPGEPMQRTGRSRVTGKQFVKRTFPVLLSRYAESMVQVKAGCLLVQAGCRDFA
jgi:hypothetical protein